MHIGLIAVLDLPPPISKFVHSVGEQEEQSLGRRAGALQNSQWRTPSISR
jgi:hypothetical protein